MNIYTFRVAGHSIRVANDQRPGEPECWKTSIDSNVWTPGHMDLGAELQYAIDRVLPRDRPALKGDSE